MVTVDDLLIHLSADLADLTHLAADLADLTRPLAGEVLFAQCDSGVPMPTG